MGLYRAAAFLIIPAICGCDDAPAELIAPNKTVSYYSQHLDEAHRVAQDCDRLGEQKQRDLSALAFQEWQVSSEGVNCQTAQSVVDAASMRAFVLKQQPGAQKPEPRPSVQKAVMPAGEAPQRSMATEQTLAP
jgi:hypothetical protein